MEDITERRQAEKALRESEQRFRSLAEDISDWIWEMDARGRFTYCNPRAAEITGFPLEELIGSTPAFLMGADEPGTEHFKAIATGTPVRQKEVTFDHRDGHPLTLEISGVPIMGPEGAPTGFRGVARDITERRQAEEERRRLEAQVQQAQKLESLGVLAGGIAHDFNNLLMGILGNADLALTGPARLCRGLRKRAGDHGRRPSAPRTSPSRCWPTRARAASSVEPRGSRTRWSRELHAPAGVVDLQEGRSSASTSRPDLPSDRGRRHPDPPGDHEPGLTNASEALGDEHGRHHHQHTGAGLRSDLPGPQPLWTPACPRDGT